MTFPSTVTEIWQTKLPALVHQAKLESKHNTKLKSLLPEISDIDGKVN